MNLLTSLLEELTNDRSTLMDILDHSPTGVIISDADGLVLYINQAQALLDDLDPGEAIGRARNEIISKTNINYPAQKNPGPV